MYAQLKKPERFKNESVIDIKSDKKLKLYISAATIAAVLVLAVIGNLFVPVTRLYDTGGFWMLALRFALILIGILIYYWLHEYIHLYIENRMTGIKAGIKREKLFAYSESRSYFSLDTYIKYCFAPVVVLGVILLLLMLILPAKYFWQVYIIQIINIAGAMGDAFVVIRLKREKQELVIKDNGTSVSYWTK